MYSSGNLPYLERCAAVTAEITDLDISERAPGTTIGSGSGLMTQPLGLVQLGGRAIHLALKRPLRYPDETRSVEIRALTDLSTYAFLDKYAPNTAKSLPWFVSELHVDGHPGPIAILTEDVSAGGTLKLHHQPVEPATLDYLTSVLSQLGNPATMLNECELNHTFAVRVQGLEKFIDADPPPFKNIAELDGLFDEAAELAASNVFSVIIGAESHLARSILL